MPIDWNNTSEVLQKRQAAIQAGYKPADVDKFIGEQKKNFATGNLVKSGQLDLKNVAKDNPVLADKLVKEGVLGNSEEAQISGIFKKIRDTAGNDIVSLFNPLSEKGNFYRSQINIATQLMAKLVEKSRLSDADRKFYLEQTAPKITDVVNPNLYKARVSGAIDSLERRAGLTPESSPGSSPQESPVNTNIQFRQGDNPLMFGAAKAQEFLGQSEALPIAYSLLGKVIGKSSKATGAGAGVGEYLKQLLASGNTIQEGGLKELIPTAGEAAGIVGKGTTYGGLDWLLSGGGKKVIEGTKDLFKPTPPKFSSEILNTGLKMANEGKALRTSVVEAASEAGKKVEGNTLSKAVSNWVIRAKRANPTQSEAIDNFLNGANKRFAGKNLTVKTATQLWEDANTGFSNAGKIGNTLESEYHRTIRDVLRKEIDKVAPGFEKGTGMIREGLAQEKLLKTIRNALERKEITTALQETPSKATTFAKGLVKPVVTGASLAALYKILGMRGQN